LDLLNRPFLSYPDQTANIGAPLAYRPDIDGLRAIAVLSVVFFHASIPWVSGGYVGVDIFFVISGYLITSLILKDIERNSFSFLKFYLRRAKRIFPALIVVLVATTVAGWFILFPEEFKKFGRSLTATTLFGSNFYFAQDVGYFSAPAIEKPLLHTWSLAIEEQFYILFPAALMFFLPRLGRWKMVLALSAVALCSLAIAEFLVRQASEIAFFMPHVRAWELLLGGLVALQQARIRLGHLTALLVSVMGIGAIVLAVTMMKPTTPFPGVNAVMPCLGAAMLLLAGGKARTPVQVLLSLSPTIFVGRISYSLYLWHWPLFSLATYHLNRSPDVAETSALVGASVVLATLSWRLVEQPIRTGMLGFTNPLRGIMIASTPLAPLAVIGLIFVVTKGLPSRLPAEVAKAYQQSRTKPAFLRKCYSAAQDDQRCRFGVPPKDGSYDIVMWGDSHAHHFVPAFAKIAEIAGLSGWEITPSACAPLLGVTVLNKNRTQRKDCDNNDNVIKQFIQANKNLKVIVIAAKWSAYNGLDGGITSEEYLTNNSEQEISVNNSRHIMAEELRKTINYFRAQGLYVVVFGQVPQFSSPPIRCNLRKMLDPAYASDCSVSLETQRSYIGYANDVIAHLNEAPQLTRIFPYEFLCDAVSCRSFADGTFLYRDADHLTPQGAETFIPFLMEKLGPMLTRLHVDSKHNYQ
jgi:peptidoglycan/LPS O-acetylase OafA/YrhL